MNKKILISWLLESIVTWILFLLMFYWFVEHNNFLTVIFIILIIITFFIFSILRKKNIIFNIFRKDNIREVMILPYVGMSLCTLFATYARYKMIEKNVFFIIFTISFICYMLWEYNNFIKS